MLASFFSLFILFSFLLTKCLSAVTATWNETVTGGFPSTNEGLKEDDFTSTTDELSLPADGVFRFEAKSLLNNEKEHFLSPQLSESSPNANNKKQPRMIMRLLCLAGAYFGILFTIILMRRHAGTLEGAKQAQLDEEEKKVGFELPPAEATQEKISAVSAVSTHGLRNSLKAARDVEDLARITQTKDLMAIQHYAATLDSFVGNAESKATLQELQSAAKRTVEAKELALKAQMKVLNSPDANEKLRGGVEIEDALKNFQKYREKMIECTSLLLQQALAVSSTRKETAVAAVRRIDEHVTNLKKLFHGFQRVNLNENVDGEHLRPHVELLQGLQQQAKVQDGKLHSAWLNMTNVNIHAVSRSSTNSLYELGAELEAAAEAARKMKRIDQVLKAITVMADTWAEGGTKAARDTLGTVSALLRTWAADSLVRTEKNAARIRGASIQQQSIRKNKELLALADLMKEKLKELQTECIQPSTIPLSVALKKMRSNDWWYDQLMRAGRDAAKMQGELYEGSLPYVDQLDAETQEKIRHKELQAARLSAEISEQEIDSLNLISPYTEFEGAAAKAAWDEITSQYDVAQQELRSTRQALKDAEATENMIELQKKAHAARESAMLGILKAVEIAEGNAELRCWLQLEKDIEIIHGLAQRQGKKERITSDLLTLRSKKTLFSAVSYLRDILERELQNKEEETFMNFAEDEKVQLSTDIPEEHSSSSSSVAWMAAFEHLVSAIKQEMAEKAQQVEDVVVKGLKLCREPKHKNTQAAHAAMDKLRDVQVKAATAQASFRKSLSILMQARTIDQAKSIFVDNVKAKKKEIGKALAEAERVLQDLEADTETESEDDD